MTTNPTPDSLARAHRLIDDLALLLTGKSVFEELDDAERVEVYEHLAEQHAQLRSEVAWADACIADVAACRHTYGCGVELQHYPDGRPMLDDAWPVHYCGREVLR